MVARSAKAHRPHLATASGEPPVPNPMEYAAKVIVALIGIIAVLGVVCILEAVEIGSCDCVLRAAQKVIGQ